ncbi:hypothetical protein [uncultured Martelella sp.]|uniref:hypothetical protein n=1 Tax=uncultured Martelella sp. TaxID=392331 RepID=UPI0029C84AFF|nr:hypothetical protein [uncultured Martelella sp.]
MIAINNRRLCRLQRPLTRLLLRIGNKHPSQKPQTFTKGKENKRETAWQKRPNAIATDAYQQITKKTERRQPAFYAPPPRLRPSSTLPRESKVQ